MLLVEIFSFMELLEVDFIYKFKEKLKNHIIIYYLFINLNY